MTEWFDLVNTVGIGGALAASIWQVRRLNVDATKRDDDRRVERALEFYKDLVVDGDTAAALNNLSVKLLAIGKKRHRVTTWYVMDDSDLQTGGLLDPRPEDPQDTLLQDFYRTLWWFQRAEAALRFGLVDEETLFDLTGFHCWWWGQLLVNVTSPVASRSQRELSARAAAWARTNGKYAYWESRCAKDFDNAGPTEL